MKKKNAEFIQDVMDHTYINDIAYGAGNCDQAKQCSSLTNKTFSVGCCGKMVYLFIGVHISQVASFFIVAVLLMNVLALSYYMFIEINYLVRWKPLWTKRSQSLLVTFLLRGSY